MIDRGLPDVWPPAAIEAVAEFRQGDLVEGPPFLYAANGECPIWALTRGIVEDGGDASVAVLAEEDGPPYGIITTQSCDLTEKASPGRTRTPCRPWFQVAPVSPSDSYSKEQVGLVLKRGFRYLVPLRPPSLQGLWLADLRIEIPVEKGWLAGRKPVHGFADLGGYRGFSLRLQELRSRVAAEGGVTDQMIDHLRDFLARDPARGKSALEPVSCIMYEAHGQGRSPTMLTLHVFPAENELPGHARELFDEWFDDYAGVCRDEGCALLPPEYGATVSPLLFSELVRIDLEYLIPGLDTA